MAGFGEDVSMGDFHPPVENSGSPEGGAGHTSDGSVLNVPTLPTMTPRTGAAPGLSMGAAGASIGAGAPLARNSKARVSVQA